MLGDHRNPYQPPNAVLEEVGRPMPSRRRGWKIYLWLMMALCTVGLLTTGLDWMQAADFLDLGFTTVSLVGLFGYAYRRCVASRSTWRLWLPLQIVWDVAVLGILSPLDLAYHIPGSEASPIVDGVLTLLLVGPLYVALYLYAFRSPDLWQSRLAD